MAKISTTVKNEKRRKLAQKFSAKRAELRAKSKNPNLSEEDRVAAQIALQKLPRNSAMIRVRNRCELTGRPRAFYRAFKLSRIMLRELALKGMLPGVTKSSW